MPFDWQANFVWYGGPVSADIDKLFGLGLKAAAQHATRRLKEVLSIPAPRKRVVRGIKLRSLKERLAAAAAGRFLKKSQKVIEYVATTPATPGAPPRKLSGHLRRSVTWEINKLPVTLTNYVRFNEMTARIGTNVRYGKYLEFAFGKSHEWLLKTILGIRHELAVIIGRPDNYSSSAAQSETD